jgi:hypothetical protein
MSRADKLKPVTIFLHKQDNKYSVVKESEFFSNTSIIIPKNIFDDEIPEVK